MGPVDAVRSVLRQYATFRGRATRPEFWWWQLAIFLGSIAVSVVDEAIKSAVGIQIAAPVFVLALLVPTLAVSVRRLHDSGLAGWWILAPYAATALGVVACIAGFLVAFGPLFFGDTHDSSAVGVMVFMVLVAGGYLMGFIGAVLNIVLMARGSTQGPNKYGPHPMAPRQPPPPTYPLPAYAPTPPPADPGGDSR